MESVVELSHDRLKQARLSDPGSCGEMRHMRNKDAPIGDRVSHKRAVERRKGLSVNHDGRHDLLNRQRQRAGRKSGLLRTFPPDVEGVEVDDSGDEANDGINRRSAHHNSAFVGKWRGTALPQSVISAAFHRLTTRGKGELPWVARQLELQKQAAIAGASHPQYSRNPPMPPGVGTQTSRGMHGGRDVSPAHALSAHRVSGEVANYPEGQRGARQHVSPPVRKSMSQSLYVMRSQRQMKGGGVDSGGGGDGSVNWVTEAAMRTRRAGGDDGSTFSVRINTRNAGTPVDDGNICSGGHTNIVDRGRNKAVAAPSEGSAFGAMAPCWRLLERTKAYMQQDKFEYMKGLFQAHFKKPMTSDQMLERAQSCLDDQEKIFACFVQMFDRIEQPPVVPLYSATRRHHTQPESGSNTSRCPPSAVHIHGNAPRSTPHRGPQLTYAANINSQGSRYRQPTFSSGGFANGNGVSISTASTPRHCSLVPKSEQSDGRSWSLVSSSSAGVKRWWGTVNGNGNGATRRGSGQTPSSHRAAPAPKLFVLASRTTIFSESRRQRCGEDFDATTAWNHIPEHSHHVTASTAIGGATAGAPSADGGPLYGSRQPTSRWRGRDASVVTVAPGAHADETSRRGVERRGPASGNKGSFGAMKP